MKALGATSIVALALLAGAPSAGAAWSAPRTVALAPATTRAVAIDARGDVSVAWATTAPGTVHVATFPATGRVRKRAWAAGGARVAGLSVVVDPRGESTVAWIAGGRVRAAHGPLAGLWAAPQLLGRGAAAPELAVSGDGRVLLVWSYSPDDARRTGVAWRAPGQDFAAPRALGRPRALWSPYSVLGAPVPAFDARGAAYVSGGCDAVVRHTRPGGLTFARSVLTTRSLMGLSLSVRGAGQGLATWVGGICNPDIGAEGNRPGAAFASVLARGRFGAPIALPSTSLAFGSHAAAWPGGGGVASWAESGTRTGVFSVPIDGRGTLGSAQLADDGLIPLAADAAGDLVLARLFPGPPAQFGIGGVAVHPVGGGPDQGAPTLGGEIAVSHPTGRRVALVWSPPGSTRSLLAIWRP